MTRAAVRADAPVTRAKNAVINGDFSIWQRGTSFSTPASGAYTADRWLVLYDGTGAFTVSRAGTRGGIDSAIPESPKGHQLRWDQSGSISGCSVRQLRTYIEGVSTFAGRTVTLSVKIWAPSGSTSVGLSYVQNFGSGGSPSSDVSGTINGSVALTTSPFELHTFTFTLPAVTGKTLGSNNNDYLAIVFQLPTTGTYDIRVMDVQLELGSEPTDFEQRKLAEELVLCQRYYWKPNNTLIIRAETAETTGQTYHWMAHPVTMRASPSVSFSSITYQNGNSGGGSNFRQEGFEAYFTITAGSAYMFFTPACDAEL